jgi:hypothetical protein
MLYLPATSVKYKLRAASSLMVTLTALNVWRVASTPFTNMGEGAHVLLVKDTQLTDTAAAQPPQAAAPNQAP